MIAPFGLSYSKESFHSVSACSNLVTIGSTGGGAVNRPLSPIAPNIASHRSNAASRAIESTPLFGALSISYLGMSVAPKTPLKHPRSSHQSVGRCSRIAPKSESAILMMEARKSSSTLGSRKRANA